jgi:hypothetical protein
MRDRIGASRSERENLRNRRADRKPLRTTSAVVVEQSHHLAFAEMIAAALRAELRDLFEEVGKLICAHPSETQRERVARSVMTDVRRVFTRLLPFQRNAKRVQHFRRRAIRGDFHREALRGPCGPCALNVGPDPGQ